ncbi:MAG: hypothetical protein FWH42_04305 [Dehalococcoidia bacterium]|nr:hypothetical protein [Dehalococcoidia bacterium]
MAENWIVEYERLRKFIATHDEIKIEKNGTTIPESVHKEFYEIFDAIVMAFLAEYVTQQLEVTTEIVKAYAEIKDSVLSETGFEGIATDVELRKYLTNPNKLFTGYVSNCLFDLITGKINEERFVKKTKEEIERVAKLCFQKGYMHWGVVALLQLLRPSGLWTGNPGDILLDTTHMTDYFPGMVSSEVPELQKGRWIGFCPLTIATFILPELLVKSEALNCFASLQSHWYEVRHTAKKWNEDLEWLDTQKILNEEKLAGLSYGLAIHMSQKSASELKLLVDYKRFARPDMLIEFMEEEDWYTPKRLKQLIQLDKVLKPRLGMYIVSRVIIPPEEFFPSESEQQAMMETTSAATAEMTQSHGEGLIEQVVDKSLSTPEAESISLSEKGESPIVLQAVEGTTIPNSIDNATIALEKANSSAPLQPEVKKDCPLRLADLPETIHVINAGYDVSAFEPIFQALSQRFVEQDQANNVEKVVSSEINAEKTQEAVESDETGGTSQ